METKADQLKTWVKRVTLPPPNLEDHRGDLDRLKAALFKKYGIHDLQVDLAAARELTELLCRQSETRLRLTLFQGQEQTVLTSLDPADQARPALGLAVDLGTTRYVLQVLDLESGRILGRSDQPNPQTVIGPDILTRIHYAEEPGGAKRLQHLIQEDLQANIETLCQEKGLDPARICNIALAGNTAMTHLFLGLPCRWLIREPYVPCLNEPDLYRASDIGLRLHPLARILCFPNAGSYFGGDLLAGILFSGMTLQDEISLLVDIGTNAEVVLGNRDWLIGCAGAAGPALEGGVSAIGGTAGPGIIEKVRIDPSDLGFELKTIDDLLPVGICGSGVIDLAAELFKNGLLDVRGKLVPSRLPDRIRIDNSRLSLVLVPARESGTGRDLLIAQPDFDSLMRSKAAMYTILETLITSVGISFDDIQAFYVAGTFGQWINPESAVSIGMLPDIPRELFEVLGNSSLGGATRLLQGPESLQIISESLDRLTYLELNVNQAFMNAFSAAKFFPHTDRSKFPSVNWVQTS